MDEWFDSSHLLGAARVWFDAESFEEADQYEDLLERMIAISNGKFNPEAITWKFYHYSSIQTSDHVYVAEVTFTINRSSYTIRLLCEGWFDEALLASINKIISFQGSISERFYMLSTVDQSGVIMFLDEEVTHKLKEEGKIDEEYSLPKPEGFVSLIQ